MVPNFLLSLNYVYYFRQHMLISEALSLPSCYDVVLWAFVAGLQTIHLFHCPTDNFYYVTKIGALLRCFLCAGDFLDGWSFDVSLSERTVYYVEFERRCEQMRGQAALEGSKDLQRLLWRSAQHRQCLVGDCRVQLPRSQWHADTLAWWGIATAMYRQKLVNDIVSYF